MAPVNYKSIANTYDVVCNQGPWKILVFETNNKIILITRMEAI